MLELLEPHLPEVARLCDRCGIKRLELFGSAARADFDPRDSDIDFLVEFIDQGWQGSFKRYMNLKLGLEDLLGRPVDLVEAGAISNPHFASQILQDRMPIYAA